MVLENTCQVPSTFWSSTSTSTSTLTFPYIKYSSTNKYVLKYKYCT